MKNLRKLFRAKNNKALKKNGDIAKAVNRDRKGILSTACLQT